MKVWEALIVHADGHTTTMRLSGYDNRENAIKAARNRIKLAKVKGAKVKACRFSHTEE